MNPHRPVRVFIVDDHEVVREGVRFTLERAGGFKVVGEAGTAAEGLRGIAETLPDVAVVDVRMPGGDAIQFVREVRARDPRVRCLVFTPLPDENAFAQAMMAGASGYLGKDANTEELVTIIRSLAAGRSMLPWEKDGALREHGRGLPSHDQLLSELTDRERRILELVADGLTNREIAKHLFLAEKTVRNYVSSILGKLGMKNRTQVAAYAARTAVRPRHEAVRRPR